MKEELPNRVAGPQVFQFDVTALNDEQRQGAALVRANSILSGALN